MVITLLGIIQHFAFLKLLLVASKEFKDVCVVHIIQNVIVLIFGMFRMVFVFVAVLALGLQGWLFA